MNKIHIFIVVFYAFCVARVLPTTYLYVPQDNILATDFVEICTINVTYNIFSNILFFYYKSSKGLFICCRFFVLTWV